MAKLILEDTPTKSDRIKR